MNMGVKRRKKRADIYREIVNVLKTGSYNILQISDKTKTNWETVRNAVETLEKIGLISKEVKNNKTFYFVDESGIIDFNDNTLLGLPITKKQENTICSLAKRIVLKWNKLVPHKVLRKTFLQKILVKLIMDEKIEDIPYGWYLFGMCTVLQVEPNDLIEMNCKVEDKYDKKIESIIREYSQLSTTRQLLTKHYTDEGNVLYLSRLKLSNILNNTFDEHSINLLKIELRNFLFNFTKKEDNQEIIEYLNGFASIVIRLANKLNPNELEDLRPEINETFMIIWEMLGTYNLYESVKRFYGELAKKHYLIRVESLKNIANNYLAALQDNIPLIEQKQDSLAKFKGSLA